MCRLEDITNEAVNSILMRDKVSSALREKSHPSGRLKKLTDLIMNVHSVRSIYFTSRYKIHCFALLLGSKCISLA
jgi:hypothetical protein